MNATVNGEPRMLPDGATLHDLLCALQLPSTGIAIAVNEQVVRRASFASHTLTDGDAVEIIRAVAGG
jgi:sulfur carrier protein